MDHKLMEFVGEKHFPFVKMIDNYMKFLDELYIHLLKKDYSSFNTNIQKNPKFVKEIKKFLLENNYGDKSQIFTLT